jgi:hypothetical protein
VVNVVPGGNDMMVEGSLFLFDAYIDLRPWIIHFTLMRKPVISFTEVFEPPANFDDNVMLLCW